jgi:hypothetical protein
VAAGDEAWAGRLLGLSEGISLARPRRNATVWTLHANDEGLQALREAHIAFSQPKRSCKGFSPCFSFSFFLLYSFLLL